MAAAGAFEFLARLKRQPERMANLAMRPAMTARDRTREWLHRLGIDSQDLLRIRWIHISGTKGKGSVCCHVNSILSSQRHRYRIGKVGLLTKPHLNEPRERICINSRPIEAAVLNDHAQRLETLFRRHTDLPVPGFGSFMALTGLSVFVEEMVDIAIVETGVGGQDDSTNVIPGRVIAGISSIGLDHQHYLGSTIEEVAWAKGGIIKHGCPVFAADQDPSALRVLRQRAEEQQAPNGLQVVRDRTFELGVGRDLQPFQRMNMSVALTVSEALFKGIHPGFAMTPDIASAVEHTHLPGKCEIVTAGAIHWFFSSAHNHMSLICDSKWAASRKRRHGDIPIILLFFHRSWRDAYGMIATIRQAFSEVNCDLIEALFPCSESLQSQQPGRDGKCPVFHRLVQCLLETSKEIRHAVDLQAVWQGLDPRCTATITATLHATIDFVKHKYSSADVLVIGSAYLAGAMRNLVLNTPERVVQICL